MLSSSKFKKLCKQNKVNIDQLSGHLSRGGLTKAKAVSAVKNWQKGLFKPKPTSKDVDSLASALGVESNAISQWQSSYKYAPSSPSKARLVTQLIMGRRVQDALDLLKFTNKRASSMTLQVLKSAIASAEEKGADSADLFICEARVDGAGRRIGTKTWIAKDRGRAHPIKKQASHIYVTVTEEK